MKYAYTKQSSKSFDDTAAALKDGLQQVGFGVLFEVDVADTLKKKIDAELPGRYVILGACNPALAHKSLLAEYEMGVLLPCNLIVYEKDGAVFASAIVPTVAMQEIESADVRAVAEVAEERLKSVIDSL